MSNDKVIVTGILTDKSMTVQGTMAQGRTVEQAVRALQPDVAKLVSQRYDLQPALDAANMTAKYFPSGT
jgi:hypothetical protein